MIGLIRCPPDIGGPEKAPEEGAGGNAKRFAHHMGKPLVNPSEHPGTNIHLKCPERKLLFAFLFKL
jgi:hypothetical protein